jgi:hypothetical protein
MAEGPGRLLLSQVEYARRRGFSKQYVGQLVARGKIVLVGGMVDVLAADAALAQSHDPARYASRPIRADVPDQAAPGLQHSFAKARTIREHFRALREKLEYESSTAALVPRAEIEDAAREAGRIVREAVFASAEPAAAELAEAFPGLHPDEAAAVIARHLHGALTQAADQLETVSRVADLRGAAGVEPGSGSAASP